MNAKQPRLLRISTTLTRAFAAGTLALALCAPLGAAAQTASDPWRFALTPYLWLPNVDGTLKYSLPPGSGSPEIEVGPNDYLTNLDFGFLLAGEARKGKWSVFTDVIYLDFSGEGGSVKAVDFTGPGGRVSVGAGIDAGTRISLKGAVWTLGGGYSVVQTPTADLDLFGGFRYFGVETSTDWNLTATVTGPLGGSQVFPRSGNISQDEDLWDALVGVRGRVKLGESNWSLPYYLDVGTGSSSLTWQGLLGVAYAFQWGDVVLAYRHLYYDQDNDKLIQDMRLSGPALGATLRF